MREVDSQNIVRVWERRDGFVKDQIFLGLICALLDATECCSLILFLCYSLTIVATVLVSYTELHLECVNSMHKVQVRKIVE